MRFKLYFILCVCLSALFVSCEDNEDTPRPEPLDGSRTVLVYIVADHNGLNENDNNRDFADRDIQEMLQGMKSVDTSLFNLLVYVDDNNAPVLFRIGKDSKGNTYKDILKEYNEQVSTDVSVMKEVLNRAFYEYPADSYGLVYWSHGEGWIPYPLRATSKASTRWIGQDCGDGDSRMDISEFASVLASAPHMDFIMFDACFMLSVEVAYELREFTDYYIGSPSENPGPGAPYDQIVPLMFRKNAAIEMAMGYFDTYNALYRDGIEIANDNWTGGTAIGVLRTEALEDLAEATKKALTGATMDNAGLRQHVFNYDKRSAFSSYYVGYFDLVGMMDNLLSEDAFTVWKKTFDAALSYWNTTERIYSMYAYMFSMKGALGVTHYIPNANNSTALSAYRSTAWYTDAGLNQFQDSGW